MEPQLQQILADHALSKEVRALGLSEQEQSEIRFFKSNPASSVSEWPFTFPGNWPAKRIEEFARYLKPCAALNYVLSATPEPRRSEAFEIISNFMVLQWAQRHTKAQSDKAQQTRGRVSEDGESIKTISTDLLKRREHKDATPGELWLHLYAELDAHGLAPKEIRNLNNRRKDYYQYDTHLGPKKISRGRFYNLVSEIKKISRQQSQRLPAC